MKEAKWDRVSCPKKNIYLIGFMGTGKTSVSAFLKRILPMEEMEMDNKIALNEAMSVMEIFEKRGEEYFRDCETNTLKHLHGKTGIIVSCGGGVILRQENVDLMKRNGIVVLLTASPDVIYKRVKYNHSRPLLNQSMTITYISALLNQRQEKYHQAADFAIDTDGKSVSAVGQELIKKLEVWPGFA